jgi:hypothetical protein
MSRRPRTPAPVDPADLADMLGEAPAAPGMVRVRNVFRDAIWHSAGRIEAGEVAEVSAADADLLVSHGLVEVVP